MELRILGDKTLTLLAREIGLQLKTPSGSVRVVDAGYDSWLRETMDPQSESRQSGSDVWIYILSPRVLESMPDIDQRLDALLGALSEAPDRPQVLFGTLFADRRAALPLTSGLSQSELAARLNQRLGEFRDKNSWLHVFDLSGICLELGLRQLTDARFEANAQMYFSPAGCKLLAPAIARSVAAMNRPASKVCVVDLDNTLWKGIIGEDGLTGIQMGDAGVGFGHRRLQRDLLSMKKSGVLLAICSKNNVEEALEVFSGHPDCLLSESDFSAIEIGWGPKSEAIRRISGRLNLGLDSFVFLDDSSFECEEVRNSLPVVQVIQVPEDPLEVADLLHKLPAFDSLRVTDEDRKRAASYATEAHRESLRIKSQSPEEFYQSLGLKLVINQNPQENSARLHQLILKTNQFNLTSERLSLAEFSELMADGKWLIASLSVSDKFGDSGITGVLIVDKSEPGSWVVRNLLLSCRVIGRTVEFALMDWLVRKAAVEGAGKLVLRYRDTGRNSVGLRFLEALPARKDDENTSWTLDVASSTVPRHYVEIETLARN